MVSPDRRASAYGCSPHLRHRVGGRQHRHRRVVRRIPHRHRRVLDGRRVRRDPLILMVRKDGEANRLTAYRDSRLELGDMIGRHCT